MRDTFTPIPLPSRPESDSLVDAHQASGVFLVVGEEVEVQAVEDLLLLGYWNGVDCAVALALSGYQRHG